MKTVAAAEAKSDFDRLLASVADEEVVITEDDRPVAALVRYEEYQRVKEFLDAAEDAHWSARALEAEKDDDWMSPEESERFIRERLGAERPDAA